ncbi:hypothetical protein ANANG_G00146620 [Anguilla anguilla]|uniref:Tetraspanin n=2 Tax=Anguilla anguilla TaxID=7936 RepID=A0A9D3MBW0_ANGAN|nr:hypothetical protein ANANG_G00146620 [Anguilla anguilla]
MAEDNTFLKRLCIAFSVIYGILGGVTLGIGIVASSSDEAKDFDTTNGIVICCVNGSLVLLLALLGVFGVYKEKKWALRVYTVFLILHAIGCFRVLPAMSAVQSEINGAEDQFRELTPLNRADQKTQKAINKLQTVAECCGLLSYEDWRDSIPQSCHCPPDYEDRASKCHRVQQSRDNWADLKQSYDRDSAMSEVEVYKEPCGPIILKYLEMGIMFVTRLIVTFVVVLVLSTILHLTFNCQINNPAAVKPMTVTQDPKPPPYNPVDNQFVQLCPQ